MTFDLVALTKMWQGDDGVYTLTFPVSKDAMFPLFDAAEDSGKFVVAAMKTTPSGKRIFEATDYYTPTRIVDEFSEVKGVQAKFVQVTPEQYTSHLPPAVAQEFLENHLLIDSPGYYGGESLDGSLAVSLFRPLSLHDKLP
jgi:hypothetical protein